MRYRTPKSNIGHKTAKIFAIIGIVLVIIGMYLMKQ